MIPAVVPQAVSADGGLSAGMSGGGGGAGGGRSAGGGGAANGGHGYDEETAMSTFRELLKSGDTEAKAVHASFTATRDREAFQASIKTLIVARSNGPLAVIPSVESLERPLERLAFAPKPPGPQGPQEAPPEAPSQAPPGFGGFKDLFKGLGSAAAAAAGEPARTQGPPGFGEAGDISGSGGDSSGVDDGVEAWERLVSGMSRPGAREGRLMGREDLRPQRSTTGTLFGGAERGLPLGVPVLALSDTVSHFSLLGGRVPLHSRAPGRTSDMGRNLGFPVGSGLEGLEDSVGPRESDSSKSEDSGGLGGGLGSGLGGGLGGGLFGMTPQKAFGRWVAATAPPDEATRAVAPVVNALVAAIGTPPRAHGLRGQDLGQATGSVFGNDFMATPREFGLNGHNGGGGFGGFGGAPPLGGPLGGGGLLGFGNAPVNQVSMGSTVGRNQRPAQPLAQPPSSFGNLSSQDGAAGPPGFGSAFGSAFGGGFGGLSAGPSQMPHMPPPDSGHSGQRAAFGSGMFGGPTPGLPPGLATGPQLVADDRDARAAEEAWWLAQQAQQAHLARQQHQQQQHQQHQHFLQQHQQHQHNYQQQQQQQHHQHLQHLQHEHHEHQHRQQRHQHNQDQELSPRSCDLNEDSRRDRAVSFSDESVSGPGKDRSLSVDIPDLHALMVAGAAADSEGATPRKAYEPKRTLHDRPGRLAFEVPKREMLPPPPPSGAGQAQVKRPPPVIEVLSVRARARMLVSWSLPADVAQALVSNGRASQMMLGLCRLGFPTNKTSVVNKTIGGGGVGFSQESNASLGANLGGGMVGGKLEFHAPRSAGVFVYRLFDEEEPVVTYAHSPPFAVGVTLRDLDHNLKFVSQHFKAKKAALALRSLAVVFEKLQGPVPWLPAHSGGHSGGGAQQQPHCKDLEQSLSQALACAQAEFKVADDEIAKKEAEQAEAARQADADGSAGAGGAADGGKEAESSASKLLRFVGETHLALKALLTAAAANGVVWSGLGAAGRAKAVRALQCWSVVGDKFLPSPEALRLYHVESFGFAPRVDADPILRLQGQHGPDAVHRSSLSELVPLGLWQSLERQVASLLPSLLPSDQFFPRREALRRACEAAVLQGLGPRGSLALVDGSSGVGQALSELPEGSGLHMFGSSRNGFGSDGADLDMCLLVPSSGLGPRVTMAQLLGSPPPTAKAQLVDGIGRALSEAAAAGLLSAFGELEELSLRATARIPVVNFKLGGMDCDISVHNPLALRNSDMLATYSRCDPRVSEVAFVLKHWAKRRRVNNASEGTLSSYGFLLCLIHFLQTRDPPVVPNLQALPPDWTGDPSAAPPHPNRRHGALPSVTVSHPVDGRPVDTYFYTPPRGDFSALRAFGARNRSTSGELLFGFFTWLGSDLDLSEQVVAVRTGLTPLPKLAKAETDCWPVHARLSIEDPFETWYDVAHPVKKQSRFEWIKAELLRAHALLLDRAASGSGFDTLLEEVCSEAPPPPFLEVALTQARQRRESRAESLGGFTEL